MKKNWPQAVAALLRHEGGFVDHPRDPGGATNMGITLATLSRWRKRSVTKTEVRELSQREAEDIYKAWYWDEVEADRLPSGVDYAVFDYAVNSGPKQAARTLQRLLGVSADGIIGPRTLIAANMAKPDLLIARYTAWRLEFLMGLPTWKDFGRGWKRRVLEVSQMAIRMIGNEKS